MCIRDRGAGGRRVKAGGSRRGLTVCRGKERAFELRGWTERAFELRGWREGEQRQQVKTGENKTA